MSAKQAAFNRKEIKKRSMFVEAMNRLMHNKSAIFGLIITHRTSRMHSALRLVRMCSEPITWEDRCWPVSFTEAGTPF